MLDARENDDHNLSENRLGTDLIGTIQSTEIDIVASPHYMNQTIATDQHGGRSNRGEKSPKHAELDLFLSEPPGLTHQIDNLVNNIGIGIGIGVGIGAIDLGLDEVEGEQFEDAIESGLDDFGVAGFESENDRLEDGIGIGGREAEERRLVEIGGVRDGFELVQDGFAGGDELRVLAPRRVFDDLV